MRNIILILGLVFLLASCDFQDRELMCDSGTQGIDARFVNFPDTLQQTIETPLVIEFENNGAYESKAVFAWIRYGKDFFNVTEPEIRLESFPGRETWNKCTPQVRRNVTEIEAYELPFATTRFERPISIDLCYHYSNNLTTSVCVDPLPGDLGALEPNCKPSDRRIVGGQGSPLGITKIDEPLFIREAENSGRVRLGIYLENFGDGTIVANEAANDPRAACTYQESTHEDYIFIRAFLDNERLNCDTLGSSREPVEGKVFLRYDPEVIETDSGTETIKRYYLICETEPIELDTELQMTLDITMDYYYRESRVDERTTTIRKI